MDNRERIVTLLRRVQRPGIDALIDFIQTSTFFTANCHGHHFIGNGGVCQHTLEVYDFMMSHNILGLPEESIILTSVGHDLGKARKDGFNFRGRHDERSLKILDKLGVALCDDERTAILNHEPGWFYRTTTTMRCPLYALLVAGDCSSTGAWKRAHPVEVAARKSINTSSRFRR